MKALAGNEPNLLQSLDPAFKKYNEEQYTTVKLPGSSETVRVAMENLLENSLLSDFRS